MTPEQKKWIDEATYEQLLRRWRFSVTGDEIFRGESGNHYAERMEKLRDEMGNDEHVRISKAIGWDKP